MKIIDAGAQFSFGSSGGGGGTPANNLPPFAGHIGWYDAYQPSTFSLTTDNTITGLANRVPGGAGLVPAEYGAPKYNPSTTSIGGLPSVEWPYEHNDLGLTLGFDAPCSEVFVVCQFDDGQRAVWPEFITFVTPLTLKGTARTIGYSGTDHLYSNKRASINGAPFATTVLPLPLSVVRFSATDTGAPIQVASIGLRTDRPNRSWWGPICEVLAYAAPLDAGQVEQVESYLMNKWGIAA